MIESRRIDSDGDLTSMSGTIDSLGRLSRSSMSSSSFSRLSFDCTAPSSSLLEAADAAISLKPHRCSSDSAYSAMLRRSTRLGFRDFRLHRRIGAGDIGTVFLCSLDRKSRAGAEDDGDGDDGDRSVCYYAMKVVDKEAVEKKKKGERAEMERRILKMVDHPFLPTLYAEFEASHFSCIVMEFCPGGDLHSLRHKQPLQRFSLSSARFYAAEVLVALEYLHMLGIVYRDLKPENVLVRSDGHIMLSDFDLSLCSDTIAAVESPPSISPDPLPSPSQSYIRPYPAPFSCIPYTRLFRSRKIQNLTADRLFVAEPVSARSCSFVGTHEYVSPEVASGGSHGNAVDWWAFGVFIYEMIYGRTPFAGSSNKATLRNIVEKPLSFPGDSPDSASEMRARDLISGLLCKDPAKRLGSKRGSAEVKKHSFFKGLNFALVRSLTPPEIPGSRRRQTTSLYRRQLTAFDYF